MFMANVNVRVRSNELNKPFPQKYLKTICFFDTMDVVLIYWGNTKYWLDKTHILEDIVIFTWAPYFSKLLL